MALEIKIPKLILTKLNLVGLRKNYIVPFEKGLNIIYGDLDTGKSSILNLVDYCLGASTVHLYDEIESAGKYCILELELLGKVFSIKRDIFDSKKEIEVYPCSMDMIEDFFPKYYSSNYSYISRDGFFSEFLLSSMNIPITKVKQAPSKPDSSFSIVSFRDISKFLFLTQDKVGNKRLFGDNFPRIVKLKETFKLMFNVLDMQISNLDNSISEKTKNRDELNRKNTQVASFLRETQIDSLSKLEEKKLNIDKEINIVEKQLKRIDKELIASSSSFNNLRLSIYSLEKEIRKYNLNKITKGQEIKQNIALRNEYIKDINKTLATIEILNKFPNIEDSETSCPLCEQKIKISELKAHFSSTDTKVLKKEVNSLRKRKKALQNLIEKLREEIFWHEKELSIKKEKLNSSKEELDKQTKDLVSPYINQRDVLVTKRGILQGERNNIQHFFKIRRQQVSIEGEIKNLEEIIELLKTDLRNLKNNAPSIDIILNNLGDSLQAFLELVGMKNINGISISPKSYLPIIRNRDYEKITSGGIRTLSSVGYYLSLLEHSISNSVNFPSFFMIDTIAKYIGKTKNEYYKDTDNVEDKDEGLNDPDKYKNIYKYLLNLNEKYNNFGIFQKHQKVADSLRL